MLKYLFLNAPQMNTLTVGLHPTSPPKKITKHLTALCYAKFRQ